MEKTKKVADALTIPVAGGGTGVQSVAVSIDGAITLPEGPGVGFAERKEILKGAEPVGK